MDYYLLTDLAAQVGHGLAISGAETFRVEDTCLLYTSDAADE